MFFSGLAKLEALEPGNLLRNNNDRGKSLMTKSELVELIASKQTQLSVKDVELAVKSIIEAIESPRYQTTSIEQQQSE